MIDRETKRELELIISEFEDHFHSIKEKLLVLHGAIETAQVVISLFHHE